MADLLSNGVSGLLAFQRALDTTATTSRTSAREGYSRQRVDFGARVPSLFGDSYLGNGVQIDSIRRIYDELIAQQARSASSSFQRFDTYAAQAERVNNLFANTTTGLSATLQKFADALQNVASNPTSTASRQVLLSEANGVAQRLQSYDSQLAQYDREVQARLDRRSHRHLDDRPADRAAQPQDLRGHRDAPASRRTTCSTSATSC